MEPQIIKSNKQQASSITIFQEGLQIHPIENTQMRNLQNRELNNQVSIQGHSALVPLEWYSKTTQSNQGRVCHQFIQTLTENQQQHVLAKQMSQSGAINSSAQSAYQVSVQGNMRLMQEHENISLKQCGVTSLSKNPFSLGQTQAWHFKQAIGQIYNSPNYTSNLGTLDIISNPSSFQNADGSKFFQMQASIQDNKQICIVNENNLAKFSDQSRSSNFSTVQKVTILKNQMQSPVRQYPLNQILNHQPCQNGNLQCANNKEQIIISPQLFNLFDQQNYSFRQSLDSDFQTIPLMAKNESFSLNCRNGEQLKLNTFQLHSQVRSTLACNSDLHQNYVIQDGMNNLNSSAQQNAIKQHSIANGLKIVIPKNIIYQSTEDSSKIDAARLYNQDLKHNIPKLDCKQAIQIQQFPDFLSDQKDHLNAKCAKDQLLNSEAAISKIIQTSSSIELNNGDIDEVNCESIAHKSYLNKMKLQNAAQPNSLKQCKKIQKANSKKDEASPQKDFLNEALEEIIMESRLGELLKAIETILDERVPIIKSQIRFKQQTQRGSRFRGVSKNGSKWQVLVMDNQRKNYTGSIKDELTAARLYDKYAIKYQGLRAKTNFSYNRQELNRIVKQIQENIDEEAETSHQHTIHEVANNMNQ
ncbi:hypothetical protein FGO68_gene11411 [Halteria grandinella]|uniref:AP2/ERF domain-containing protein n=1 Tax=Halteria grandinella TaxID=5974 RepID=A0A8J8NZ01_HALGN|nr:hypothetical protein FGO68_gene11411 [Halteria grandinella]